MATISDAQKGQLSDQLATLYRMTSTGTRDYDTVREGVQAIIEGHYPRGLLLARSLAPGADHIGMNPAVAPVERQLDRWRELGVVINNETQEQILQQADVFEPYTDTDEPLVSGGFGYDDPKALVGRLIGAFELTDGYSVLNYIHDFDVRYAPGMAPTGGLRLVHFDPSAYAGLSPAGALKAAGRDKLRLAGIEVLERLALEPATVHGWACDRIHFFPILSGLQIRDGSSWSYVPVVGRSYHRQLSIKGEPSSYVNTCWASPVVREC